MSANWCSIGRACARVETSVLSTMEKTACWLGKYNEPLAATDWISILTCGSHMPATWCSVRRARERAESSELSELSTMEESPCWPGNFSEPFAVTDFQLNIQFLLSVNWCSVRRTCSRGEFCIVHNGHVAMLTPELE